MRLLELLKYIIVQSMLGKKDEITSIGKGTIGCGFFFILQEAVPAT